MQIEIDFDVFKALTAKLENECDTYNDAIRALLNLPAADATAAPFFEPSGTPVQATGLLGYSAGIWYSNVFFPENTVFRATYKGQTHYASIKNGVWLDSNGNFRNSPSDAASAISGTNVNGWRFWFARRPSDADWSRLDALRP